MADHGEVQYATADGNDLPTHEANYDSFVQVTLVGTIYVINILIGLTLGGVQGHWISAAGVIIIGAIAAGASLWTGTRTLSIIMLAVSALTLLFNSFT